MSKYSDDTKAAVMAALLAGQSISQVADEYNIPRSTVGNWSAKLNSAGVPTVPDTKKAELGGLLVELLQEQVISLRAWLEAARDPLWVKRQNAADLAVLFGVNYDKLAKMIEALNRASDDSTSED